MAKAERGRTTSAPRAATVRLRLTANPKQIAAMKLALKLVEQFGLRRAAAMVRNAETAPPRPQAPTPKPRRPGGGRKQKFNLEQQHWLRVRYLRDLKKDQRLAKQDAAAVPHAKKLAKDKYGIDAGRNTLLEQIIRPVLREVQKNQK